MSNCCQCVITSPSLVGVLVPNDDVLPEEVKKVIQQLRDSGANLNADVLFTFFWDNDQGDDLDMWISFNNSNDVSNKVGYNSGGGGNIDGTEYRAFNRQLGIGLDVDAWAEGKRPQNGSIENTGVINSSNSPDGVYGVYLDNFKNYTGRDTPFNFITLYRTERDTEFDRVIWLRGVMNKDTPKGAGDITRMMHVLDLRKEGRTFKLESITSQLEKVFEYRFGSS